MTYRDIVSAQLVRHEGFCAKPYRDTVGKSTIGYGRNLDDVGITREEAEHLLMNDIMNAEQAVRRLYHQFDYLSENRKAVLINMAFNLGENRLATFRKMQNYISAEDWKGAAKEMLASKWAQQVGNRAAELANLMERG